MPDIPQSSVDCGIEGLADVFTGCAGGGGHGSRVIVAGASDTFSVISSKPFFA